MNNLFLPRIFDNHKFDNEFPIFKIDTNKFCATEPFTYKDKWKIICNNYTVMDDNECIFANTDYRSWILTLPSNPTHKYRVQIIDYFGTWDRNNLIIYHNGNKIMSVKENFICDIKNCYLIFKFDIIEKNWEIGMKK